MMKTYAYLPKRFLKSAALGLLLSLLMADASMAAQHYRGQLLDKGQPADGLYDVEWALLDDADPRYGRDLIEPTFLPEVAVEDGELAFSLGAAFKGDSRIDVQNAWLEVRVRRSGSGELTPLLPRLALDSLDAEPDFALAKSLGGCAVAGDLTVDGNLGIGLSSPASRLMINGTLGLVRFDNQGDMIEMTAPSDVRLNASSASTFRLRVAGDDRLTIENSGEVGIGTTNPQARLDVHGAIKIDSAVGLFRITGSGACTVLCQNAAGAAGFQSGSGACINGWNSGGSHVGCASTANRCLCSAVQ